MKIELDTRTPDINIIESYSSDGVVINSKLYQNSIIVGAQQLIDNWPPQYYGELTDKHFTDLMELGPEILLIGTGRRLVFPPDTILDGLRIRGIGVEVMDTGAACRAYNFIVAEGRIVFAALLPPEN